MTVIHVEDARQHNLKGLSLDLPKGGVVAVTGPSGAGKSSLAIDILHGEGMRRFLEVLAQDARRSFPPPGEIRVGKVTGLGPTVALRQTPPLLHPAATVSSLCGIAPFLYRWFSLDGQAECPRCDRPIAATHPGAAAADLFATLPGELVDIAVPLAAGTGVPRERRLEEYRLRGYLRAWAAGTWYYLDDIPVGGRLPGDEVAVSLDTLEVIGENRRQIEESLSIAFQEGGEALVLAQGRRMRYGAVARCPECGFAAPARSPALFARQAAEPEADSGARAYLLAGETLPAWLAREVCEAAALLERAGHTIRPGSAAHFLSRAIGSRLDSLRRLHAGYLPLGRPAATLSAGEVQRCRLAAQIGQAMGGLITILDEPTIGLHPLEVEGLLGELRRLTAGEGTVVVVEHDPRMIAAADWVVELGPGGGEEGGRLVFNGPATRWPGRRARAKAPGVEPVAPGREGEIELAGIRFRTLRGVDAAFPVPGWTTVCGVSGSGKSTLVFEVLAREVSAWLAGVPGPQRASHCRLPGKLARLVTVGRRNLRGSARSCPATYLGVMTRIAEVFAKLPEARMRGFSSRRFLFNVSGGRCEACHGLGVRRRPLTGGMEVEVECPVCHGRRFQDETMAVRFRGRSIADVLDLSIAAAADLLTPFARLRRPLLAAVEIGLGYLKLGQRGDLLSGGEAQRLFLARELEAPPAGATLYLFDEPTVGLHEDDVERLVAFLSRLVSAGHGVVGVENHPALIHAAGRVIEMGPAGGANGGQVLYCGTPAGLAAAGTPTARFLRA